MPRRQYILIISYDGTRFHGFQRQIANDKAHTHNTVVANTTTNNNNNNKVVGAMKKRPRVDLATGERPPLVLNHKTITVQECLECAILHWLSTSTSTTASGKNWTLEALNLRVAGRTDKGVHARGQVVAVQLPEEALFISKNDNQQLLEPWQIQRGIHGRLPIDINIQRVIPVDPNKPLFDPRGHAERKQYSYTLKYQRKTTDNMPQVGAQTFRTALDDSSPCVWLCPYVLDDAKLQAACRALQGTHDYSAFVHKEARAEKDNALTIHRFDMEILKEYQPPGLYWNTDDNDVNNIHPQIVLARFYVEGQRFRRTMVRNLIGFLVEVGRGTETLEDMESTIWTGSDKAADRIPVAPASGLCLEFVKY